ncbi:hypothetical protein tinsulaeT_27930 [Thalassotalea insulae]|uniref:OmpR/PhoB-type domain-containing protein n=1 Tax=Thalassotalea insulae TaxID=2056778 RepID=A0ABQ6GU59_9GAMM|nr:winged helix-turn-helix domain-containing protein [Thalassotalea insulae]GLX79453.1 hypothetical protein tinsulaeT_27930 [Thalassotalea insulae]
MATQYWVGDFFIDLTRNQITQKMQSQTIPPKALAVLTCLAKNANKVVSHDTLLSEVWPDTVVTPNTLQRSIAQLRKALGEGSQSYIKTHAKQGYSLECEVRWQENNGVESLVKQEQEQLSTVHTEVALNTDSATVDNAQQHSNTPLQNVHPAPKKPARSALALIAMLLILVMLALVSTHYFSPTKTVDLSIGELRLLTATDNKETGGIYTPDGEYIVFLRYSEKTCIHSNIWAKNINTQKETQLTTNMGVYRGLSFSKDGKKLVVIKTENCEAPVTQKYCYKLMFLDFDQALQTPQSPNILMECKHSSIKKSTWLNNNNIAYLHSTGNRWRLASYSIADNKSTTIYAIEDGNIIDYDYSVSENVIALTSTHSDNQNYIERLTPDGQILSSHQIEYPPEITNSRFIYPNFTPINEQLIFSTGRQLFTLSYQGKITNISLPLDEPIGSPIFHPGGQRMLVIKGHWDSDIAATSLAQLIQPQTVEAQVVQTQTKGNTHYSIIERSRLEEGNAIYQPHGKFIAFMSARSGESQVWLTDGNGSHQLSHFPVDTFIMGMNWAADGQSLLVNANNQLVQVLLNSQQRPVPFEYRVEQLFQWDSKDNSALLIARIGGILRLVELNLNNSSFKVITDKRVNWALKSEDGQLVYTDHMDRFWQQGPAEDRLIEALNSQGSDKRFVMKDNVIWGVNEQWQLWSYSLNENVFTLFGNMPKNLDYLNDINNTDILTTLRITAKKEVAELTLSN